jgi:hypothetical protein
MIQETGFLYPGEEIQHFLQGIANFITEKVAQNPVSQNPKYKLPDCLFKPLLLMTHVAQHPERRARSVFRLRKASALNAPGLQSKGRSSAQHQLMSHSECSLALRRIATIQFVILSAAQRNEESHLWHQASNPSFLLQPFKPGLSMTAYSFILDKPLVFPRQAGADIDPITHAPGRVSVYLQTQVFYIYR